MRRIVVFFAAVLSAAVFSGCDFSSPKVDLWPEVPVFTVDANVVLANVNGEDVTAGDYRDRYNVEKAIYRYSNGRKAAAQIDQMVEQFMAGRMGKILAEIVNQRLIDQYLRKEGVKVQKEAVDAFVDDCLRKFQYKKGGLDDFAKELGVDDGYFRRQLTTPLRVDAARNHFGKGPFTVTEAEIDEGLARQDRYRDMAVASNAVTWATCSNVLAKVREPDVDFAVAGEKYGQYKPDEAVRWETLEYSEIENDELKEWAFKAPVGSIGGPFDLDDGLSIVKILDRTDGTLLDSVVTEQVADVTLARITFYMLVTDPEPHTREFVRESLTRWKADKAQKELFKKLHDEMKLVYVHGDNFTFETKKKETDNEQNGK